MLDFSKIRKFNEDAAADLFAEIGYESVTTDEIAARADTSVGGLSNFSPDLAKNIIFYLGSYSPKYSSFN
ncbi:MAG: helix-turn-helix domain-containing protein [Pleurocapsa sp. MO_226.B13]|nr:helix-turn-helix domain-containing protein [Pleurocapsa sp. MO_226.B13]